jgi:hypothetical protein
MIKPKGATAIECGAPIKGDSLEQCEREFFDHLSALRTEIPGLPARVDAPPLWTVGSGRDIHRGVDPSEMLKSQIGLLKAQQKIATWPDEVAKPIAKHSEEIRAWLIRLAEHVTPKPKTRRVEAWRQCPHCKVGVGTSDGSPKLSPSLSRRGYKCGSCGGRWSYVLREGEIVLTSLQISDPVP